MILVALAALLSAAAGPSDTLAVALRLEPGLATAAIKLGAPGYLVVLDLTTPRNIEILVPESEPQRLPAGISEIQLDRPKPLAPDSAGLAAPKFKPCTEPQKISDSDSTRFVATDACGSAPKSATSPGHPAPVPKGEHTVLLLVASSPLDAAGVRKAIGRVRKSPDADAARRAVLAELAKAGNLQWAIVVIPPG
jgi:hypothetical protein